MAGLRENPISGMMAKMLLMGSLFSLFYILYLSNYFKQNI